MIKPLATLALLTIFALPGAAFAKDKCSVGNAMDPPRCYFMLDKIHTIKIEDYGIKSKKKNSNLERLSCDKFELTPKIVKAYLYKAEVVDKREVRNKRPRSPCYARGSLTFVSGKKAHWAIGLLRDGQLRIDGFVNLMLDCPTCNFKQFEYEK